jgi:hypothetical protein
MASLEGRPMSAWRYDYYDPLVDVAVWTFAASFTVVMTLRYSDLAGKIEPLLMSALYFVGYANWLFCAFLVCARFMRDEFAEALWKRAAEAFTFMVVLTPTLAVFAFYLFAPYFVTAGAVPTAAAKAAMAAYPDPQTWQMSGALSLANYIAAYVPALFLIVYKWHRWWAS